MRYKTPKKKTVLNYRKRCKTLTEKLSRANRKIKDLKKEVQRRGISEYQHGLDQAQITALREQIIKYKAGARDSDFEHIKSTTVTV